MTNAPIYWGHFFVYWLVSKTLLKWGKPFFWLFHTFFYGEFVTQQWL